MGTKKRVRVKTIQRFDGNATELKRARYILDFLQTKSESHAQHVSGLSRHSHQRIIQMFIEKGHFFYGQHPGRPVAYTKDVMESAYDLLVGSEGSSMTGRLLREKLIRAGVLPVTSDIDTFMRRFKQYVEERGHRLITNSVNTTFFISRPDMAERLKFATYMVRELKTRSLNNLIWEDETILEEYPHPKGRTYL